METANFLKRLSHAWNAFLRKDDHTSGVGYGNSMYYARPDKIRYLHGIDRSMISSIYTRIAMDVATINIYHARVNQNGSFEEVLHTGLNTCLTLEANLDQSSRAFIQDVVMSLFEDGSVAIVPVDATENIFQTREFDVKTLRAGKILEWFPQHVRVNLYNDRTGNFEEIILPKRNIAIVENPLYAIMNEPNSMVQRLIRKLNLLDVADDRINSNKLDLIIQLPYTTKTEIAKNHAENRRKLVEDQLVNSPYGIAYIDGTEHITQLNRAVENNLLKEVEYLTGMVFNQLGLTQAVFDGTADEQAMLNYYNRTVEPVMGAICDAMKRAFLTKTAITQGQSIVYIRSPFKLVPVNNLADIVDKFTRNEILSSNEVRAIIGYKPVDDPRADELRNKNISASKDQLRESGPTAAETIKEEN